MRLMRRLNHDSGSPGAARVLPPRQLIDLVRGVASAGGSLWLKVTGISMNPVVRDGDSVLLAGLTHPPRRGDVVFLDLGGTPLLHRVQKVDVATIVTRGDAARMDDAPAPAAACIARALAVRRGAVTVALIPTLRFGVKALLWHAAWRLRVRLPPSMDPRVQTRPRAITRALF